MIDLHSHSTFSDGSLEPAQLVRRAGELGLKALALTDHDTTAGLGQFMEACRVQGVIGVPGVEVSVDVTGGTMHMLGYFVDGDSRGLQDMLERLRGGRADRNLEILAKLNALGFGLTFADVKEFAAEDVVGRPHIAQAMVRKGFVESKEAAFERYLGKGKPAYVERYRMTPADSIAVIAGAGGVPVLAHPFTLNLGRKELRSFVRELGGLGLGGVEVYYSEHTPTQVRKYLSLASDFGLVATGGSDFHGAMNPGIELGRGFGNLRIADSILQELEQRRNCRVGCIS